MANILIVAEHDGATLNPSVAKCVACAAQIPDAVIDLLVMAVSGENIAAQAAAIRSFLRP